MALISCVAALIFFIVSFARHWLSDNANRTAVGCTGCLGLSLSGFISFAIAAALYGGSLGIDTRDWSPEQLETGRWAYAGSLTIIGLVATVLLKRDSAAREERQIKAIRRASADKPKGINSASIGHSEESNFHEAVNSFSLRRMLHHPLAELISFIAAILGIIGFCIQFLKK
jgi:hypothetical protein